MYKKVIFSFAVLLLFTGCSGIKSSDVSSKKFKKNVIKAEFICNTEDSNFNLFLEDGQIVKYIDSVDGELGQETVDILNSEHLVNVTDNDEALKIMDAALKDLNGHCEKVLEQE